MVNLAGLRVGLVGVCVPITRDRPLSVGSSASPLRKLARGLTPSRFRRSVESCLAATDTRAKSFDCGHVSAGDLLISNAEMPNNSYCFNIFGESLHFFELRGSLVGLVENLIFYT